MSSSNTTSNTITSNNSSSSPLGHLLDCYGNDINSSNNNSNNNNNINNNIINNNNNNNRGNITNNTLLATSSASDSYNAKNNAKAKRAHDLSDTIIFASGRHFRDQHGRYLLLRGVNVAGHSKLPTSPPGSTHLSEGFFNHRNVSFMGRPFRADEIHEHFQRLRAWGLTFIRLLVTWESIEHSGPGIYDEQYISYLIVVAKAAHKYGIKCFVDPHQDCWSRFSGGSGAPGWTFEVVGLDLKTFKTVGAAHVHNMAADTDDPHMFWPTNYAKLACATMFTLFFAGETFAPDVKINGESISSYLQGCFTRAFMHLAKRMKDCASIMGFEMMNEPHYGYIGLPDLTKFDPLAYLHFGNFPSALQSFALGDGLEVEVDVWVKSWPVPTRKAGTKMMNSERVTSWLDGKGCIWKRHGVWDVDPTTGALRALKPDYFHIHPVTGTKINFLNDFYLPFARRYASAIQSVNPKLLVFVEPIPNEDPPCFTEEDRKHPGLVWAPHWYDLFALSTKSFGMVTHDVQQLVRGKSIFSATYFGLSGAQRNFTGQITTIVKKSLANVGNLPIVFGECGIPMDINEKKAFQTGNYDVHTTFLNAVINALEGNLVNFTLWNYSPGNDNIFGDHWNGEDFSIYSQVPSRTESPSVGESKDVKKKHEDEEGDGNSNEPKLISPKPRPPASRLAVDITSKLLESQVSSMTSVHSATSATSATSTATSVIPATPFDITNAYFHGDEDHLEGDPNHQAHEGGRALDAIIRPYASKIAGYPLLTKFDLDSLEYCLEFEVEVLDSDEITPLTELIHSKAGVPRCLMTEIFVPNFHYKFPDVSLNVEVSDGEWMYSQERQTLYWARDPMYRGERGSLPGTSPSSVLSLSSSSSSSSSVNQKVIRHWIRFSSPKFKKEPESTLSKVYVVAASAVAVVGLAYSWLFSSSK